MRENESRARTSGHLSQRFRTPEILGRGMQSGKNETHEGQVRE